MHEKKPLLISGCLLGLSCRYDGKSKPLPEQTLARLQAAFCLIPACPEQLGGLASPREPSERRGERFFSRSGVDVTAQYQKGAQETLRLAERFGCRYALMKEKSPSCGFGQIYDGSFSSRLIAGNGATAALLAAHGITVFGESQIPDLLTLAE